MERERGLTLYVLCGFVFLYPFFPLIKEWYPSIGTVLEFVFVILLFFSSFTYKKEGKLHFSLSLNTIVSVCFFFAYYIVGITNELSSPISGIRCFLLYIFLYAYLKAQKIDDKAMTLLSKAVFLGAIVSAIGAIVQFVNPEPITSLRSEEMLEHLRYKSDYTAFSKYNRTFSFFNDPNVLGVYLFFCFVLYSRYVAWQKNSKGKLAIVLYAIFVIAIILTQSRTAIFSLGIYVVLIMISDFFKKGLSAKKLVLIWLALIVGGFLIIQNWEAILKFLRADTIISGNGRFAKNDGHIDMLLESDTVNLFFGHGLFDGREIIFENTYTNIIYMFGFLGMIVFYLLVIVMFKSGMCRENKTLLLSYLLISYIGDYVLIPQITYIFIFVYVFNEKVNHSLLNRGGEHENFASHQAVRHGWSRTDSSITAKKLKRSGI